MAESKAKEVPAGIPVLVLKEGTRRTRGREAMLQNITVAKTLSEVLRTTLGPKGMQKMLVDSFGDVVITNDGATVMKEIEVEHPTAKMLVEVAKTQDQEAGDGTTTSVILAGELLGNAQELLELNIHPTIIVKGYKLAAAKALEIVRDSAIEVKWDDRDVLKKVAMIALGSKTSGIHKEYLSDLAAEAALRVVQERDGRRIVDLDDVKIEKKEGGTLTDTKLINGVVIDKEIVHPGMKKRVPNAKIALIESALEIKKLEFDSKLSITSPEKMRAFMEQERELLKEMVEKIKNVGANFVFCQKGIDDVAQHYLAKYGISAVRRVRKSDMEKLAKATGGKIVANLRDLSSEDLGVAELVEERRVGEDKIVFVEGCKNPKAVTILIRGGSKQVTDEAERSIHDALSVIKDVIEDATIVPGGGAIEAEISMKLRDYAESVGGKEQKAIERFADAVEVIPRTLIENSGFDTVTKMAELVKKHHEGMKNAGINIFTGEVEDMVELGVIEPARVKLQAIKSAAEAAETILRIDDIIASSKIE